MAEPAIVIESEEVEQPPVNLDEPAGTQQQEPAPKPQRAAPAEPGKPSIEEELQQYKQRLIQADQARQQAAQQAAEAQREIATARTQVADGQYHTLRNASQARQAEIEGLKQNLQKAWETGNFAEAADHQAKLAEAAAEKTQYDMWLNQMEEQRKAPPQQQPQRQQPANPVEQYLANIPDPRARDWLRSHPDCLPGQSLHNAAMSAHYDALKNNLPQGSDEYWQHVETQTGYREAPRVTNASPPSRRQPSVSAPPSRSAPGLNGQQKSNGSRMLSQREYDIAQHPPFNGDLEEYYKHREGAKADGNYYKPHNFEG